MCDFQLVYPTVAMSPLGSTREAAILALWRLRRTTAAIHSSGDSDSQRAAKRLHGEAEDVRKPRKQLLWPISEVQPG